MTIKFDLVLLQEVVSLETASDDISCHFTSFFSSSALVKTNSQHRDLHRKHETLIRHFSKFSMSLFSLLVS